PHSATRPARPRRTDRARRPLPAPPRSPPSRRIAWMTAATRPTRYGCTACLCLLLLLSAAPAQQLTPEQQADMLLGSARKAYNEKNYPFAAQRFREFLARFGGHKEARS